jgi:hypothetical protein
MSFGNLAGTANVFLTGGNEVRSFAMFQLETSWNISMVPAAYGRSHWYIAAKRSYESAQNETFIRGC